MGQNSTQKKELVDRIQSKTGSTMAKSGLGVSGTTPTTDKDSNGLWRVRCNYRPCPCKFFNPSVPAVNNLRFLVLENREQWNEKCELKIFRKKYRSWIAKIIEWVTFVHFLINLDSDKAAYAFLSPPTKNFKVIIAHLWIPQIDRRDWLITNILF